MRRSSLVQVVILAGNPREIKLAGFLVALCVDCGNTIALYPYYRLSHQNYFNSDFKSDSDDLFADFPEQVATVQISYGAVG